MQTLNAKTRAIKEISKAVVKEKNKWKQTYDTVDVNGTMTVVPGKLVREESSGESRGESESNRFFDAVIVFIGIILIVGFVINKIAEFINKHKS